MRFTTSLKGVYRGQFDPAGAYSTFDPRQPSLEAMERSGLFCKRIREAVGNEVRSPVRNPRPVLTHLRRYIRFAARHLEATILWFEEPVPPEMPEEMAKVARQTKVPIATGERLCTKWRIRAGAGNRRGFDPADEFRAVWAACWRRKKSPA